jgi:serine/threonine protein kinase
MAETFEATRAAAGGFEQHVCLKRVLPAFSGDDEFVARFRREAKLAAQLRHTNIVGVIDFGEVDGVHYMTLELVDGVDLRSFLKSSPSEKLSPDAVALIGLDLAYALEHAHGSLVHRDISPSNILLSRSGETKLADFGIAKAIDNANVTASRTAKGKIPYMSPEYMRGETTDGRADLFSLGVVLFEAVAGVRPFDGAHDVETMQKILDGDRRSLADVAPEVPAPLREVIEHLIEVDPSARTQSATQLIEELAVVAPAPTVRRELASTVEAHRGGPKARMHVRAREEERDTELTRPPRLVQTSPTQQAPRSRGRALMLAGALLGLLITAAAASQWLERGAQTPVPVPAPAPVTALASVPVTALAPRLFFVARLGEAG